MNESMLMMSAKKSGGSGSSYEDFSVWIGSRRDIIAPTPGNIAGNMGLTNYRTTNKLLLTEYTVSNVESNSLYGSSYGSYFTDDSGAVMITLHGLPSRFIRDQLVGWKVGLVNRSMGTRGPYSRLDRNGYASNTYSSYPGSALFRLIYPDRASGKMVYVEPFSQMMEPRPWSIEDGLGPY